MPTNDKSNTNDFFVEDYKLRIDYLSAHHNRMWTRFNFFLTLQSGLIAFMLLKDNAGLSNVAPLVLFALMVLSLIWWLFGAQDRWLSHAYRESINDAAKVLREKLQLSDYVAVGDYRASFDSEQPTILKNPVQWYRRYASITRLAAYVPLLTLIIWLLLASYYIYSTDIANHWMLVTLFGVMLVISLIVVAICANSDSK